MPASAASRSTRRSVSNTTTERRLLARQRRTPRPHLGRAGELGLPILIHTADPVAFWQPVDDHNFWNGVLYGEYAWWSYYRKGFPSRDELLAERNEVIRRHPRATFICPHVGSRADSLDLAADDLDAMPNLFYDLSARIPILGLPGRHATGRRFLIEFQDRVLFGTDSIYDDTNVRPASRPSASTSPTKSRSTAPTRAKSTSRPPSSSSVRTSTS